MINKNKKILIISLLIFIISIIVFLYLFLKPKASVYEAYEAVYEYCKTTFEKTEWRECPKDKCEIICGAGSDLSGCPPECVPKSCSIFEVDNCPDWCFVKTSDTGKKSCYSNYRIVQ